jgi:single-strand DNA-binding protein
MRNVLRIVGHLGGDADLKTLTSGSVVLNFSVATTEVWKDSKTGEKKQQTTWVSCSKFFGQNESQAITQFLKKGTHVMVEGKASARAYMNKNNVAEAILELRVSEILLLDSKKDDSQKPQQENKASEYVVDNPTTQPSLVPNSEPEDDLPF